MAKIPLPWFISGQSLDIPLPTIPSPWFVPRTAEKPLELPEPKTPIGVQPVPAINELETIQRRAAMAQLPRTPMEATGGEDATQGVPVGQVQGSFMVNGRRVNFDYSGGKSDARYGDTGTSFQMPVAGSGIDAWGNRSADILRKSVESAPPLPEPYVKYAMDPMGVPYTRDGKKVVVERVSYDPPGMAPSLADIMTRIRNKGLAQQEQAIDAEMAAGTPELKQAAVEAEIRQKIAQGQLIGAQAAAVPIQTGAQAGLQGAQARRIQAELPGIEAQSIEQARVARLPPAMRGAEVAEEEMTKFLQAYAMLTTSSAMDEAVVDAKIADLQPPPPPEQIPMIKQQLLKNIADYRTGQRGAFAAGVVGQKVPTNQLNFGTAQ